MQLYTENDIASKYTPAGILLTAIHMHLFYYKQQGGLPATIILDIKENGRALMKAYFICLTKYEAPLPERAISKSIVTKQEFIDFCMYNFAKIANMIHQCFDTCGVGKAESVIDEYYEYMSIICLPVLATGLYQGTAVWPDKYSVN